LRDGQQLPKGPTGGIILDRNRRAVLMALQAGRRYGERAAYQTIDALAEELAATRAELQRLRDRYRLARSIIERSDAIAAMEERENGVTDSGTERNGLAVTGDGSTMSRIIRLRSVQTTCGEL
jgi:hypothetical protein